MKPRPIVRLGLFLVSYSFLVSVVCCAAGVLALLLLPVLAKNTYFSENALMPGSASSMLSSHDVSEANKLVNELSGVNLEPEDAAIIRRRLLVKYMSDLGAEISYHKFQPQPNHCHPLHFFSGPDSGMMKDMKENASCSAYGVNTVGIVRAPHGDGKESIVLVTPYNYKRSDSGEALSLSIGYATFSLLTRVTWLAKDIIWLIADSQYGEYAPIDAWLREYHTPAFTGLDVSGAGTSLKDNDLYMTKDKSSAERKVFDDFRRAGTMTAALVLKVAHIDDQLEDTLSIYAEASNGQMPNLDLINVVTYLAKHRQGLHVKIEKFWSLLDSKWVEILGNVFELLGKVVRSLNPGWKFGIPASEYVEGAATLASSLYYQAMGIPSGPHGAFRDFQVDAITLEISPRVLYNNKARQNDLLLRSGRSIEGVIRSVNNLLEKFHHSFFLYLLTSPSKYVSVGVYMIAFALLMAPLPLVAASLYSDFNKQALGLENGKSTSTITASDELSITFKSWKWLQAAGEVFVVHMWGAIILLLPYFMCQISDFSARTSCLLGFTFGPKPVYIILHLGFSTSSFLNIRKLGCFKISDHLGGLH